VSWEALRPDRALATHDDGIGVEAAARLLRAEADRWAEAAQESDPGARCHATLALVGQACHAVGVPPTALVAADLASLQAKPYLADYFAAPEPTDRGVTGGRRTGSDRDHRGLDAAGSLP
jgi:hypothetical protein